MSILGNRHAHARVAAHIRWHMVQQLVDTVDAVDVMAEPKVWIDVPSEKVMCQECGSYDFTTNRWERDKRPAWELQ